MEFYIKVTPGAKKDRFVEDNGQYKIYLAAEAQDGKANQALINFISNELQYVHYQGGGVGLSPKKDADDLFTGAKYSKIRKSQVYIIKGLKSRTKTIKILP